MGFLGCAAAGTGTGVVAPAFAGFKVGCELCTVAAGGTAGTTLRVFGAELDWTEVLVSAGGFDGAGGFTCATVFPWGCDGELATGREATEACTFDATDDAGAGAAWMPPDCCCMYHQPPPASSRTPAAIAATSMPFPELLDPLSCGLISSSSGSALPNVGSESSGM